MKPSKRVASQIFSIAYFCIIGGTGSFLTLIVIPETKVMKRIILQVGILLEKIGIESRYSKAAIYFLLLVCLSFLIGKLYGFLHKRLFASP